MIFTLKCLRKFRAYHIYLCHYLSPTDISYSVLYLYLLKASLQICCKYTFRGYISFKNPFSNCFSKLITNLKDIAFSILLVYHRHKLKDTHVQNHDIISAVQ